MARRSWWEGARWYAFTAVILAVLLGSETARLWRAWQVHGTVLAGPLLAAMVLALVTGAMLWWLGWIFVSERVSPTWNLVLFVGGGLWAVGMLVLFVGTHQMRGVRLVYEAFERPDTASQVTAVAYQAFVWAGMLVAMSVFARSWYRAGGFGADTPQPMP
ncbi:hypothetical protein ACFQO7_24160 [Catellatospora aurea]|uniref:Transmembrane protein n=1 Tax=Catellatospora aurea TaxID=1337874 RepID=A0ABW2H058_9ACTN